MLLDCSRNVLSQVKLCCCVYLNADPHPAIIKSSLIVLLGIDLLSSKKLYYKLKTVFV